MQIWKSVNIFVVTLKYYVKDFTLKYLLRFTFYLLREKFVYKHKETIKDVKN